MREIVYKKSMKITAAEKAFVLMFDEGSSAKICRFEGRLCLLMKNGVKTQIEKLNTENFAFINDGEYAGITSLRTIVLGRKRKTPPQAKGKKTTIAK